MGSDGRRSSLAERASISQTKSPRTLVVVVDATKEPSLPPLTYTVENIFRPGDKLYVLGVLHKIRNPLGFDQKADLNEFIGTSKKVLLDEVRRKQEGFRRILDHPMSQKFLVAKGATPELKIVTGPERKVVIAKQSVELGATWVILDEHLKSDKKYVMQNLNCNIILMQSKHKQPVVLKEMKFEKENSPFGEDVPASKFDSVSLKDKFGTLKLDSRPGTPRSSLLSSARSSVHSADPRDSNSSLDSIGMGSPSLDYIRGSPSMDYFGRPSLGSPSPSLDSILRGRESLDYMGRGRESTDSVGRGSPSLDSLRRQSNVSSESSGRGHSYPESPQRSREFPLPNLESGMAIRVAIKPEYQVSQRRVSLIRPPDQNPEVPRSSFRFDFELERKILAEAGRESGSGRAYGENIPDLLGEDPVVSKYLEMGLSREAVVLAVASFGDVQNKVVDFASSYNLMSEMGFPIPAVAGALSLYNNDRQSALAHVL